MTIFTTEAREQVAAAVTEIERHTDAEVVTVLAPAADGYRWIGLFWAAMAALVLPGLFLFLPGGLDLRTLVLIQWALFVVLGLVLTRGDIAPRLAGRGLRHARAAALARSQFLAQNLHRTSAATGMLIFVSEAERYVEILVDHGIAERIEDRAWQDIVSDFTREVAAGRTASGFTACVQAAGRLLAAAVPATHTRNELPNRLVVLEPGPE